VLLLAAAGCGGSHSRVSVTIGSRVEQVAPGTTLGQVAALYRLQPRAGNLLDVNGSVLRAGAFPGAMLLDGRRVSLHTRLRGGELIRLVAGRDRKERLKREILAVPQGMPPNPQFVLSRTPGVEVIVRGAVSHELVSARFRPEAGRQHVQRAVALTFDDGPSIYTPRVVAVLRRLHVPATFFTIGFQVDMYPQYVRLEQEAGMVVGNHSYNHPEVPPFARLPQRLAVDEIALAAESLGRAGVRPRLFRPPGGSVSPSVVRDALSLGERIVLWSVDPGDWQKGATAKQIKQAVLGAVKPGSIVILHDGGGDRDATIAALPGIIKGIRHKGLELVAIPLQ